PEVVLFPVAWFSGHFLATGAFASTAVARFAGLPWLAGFTRLAPAAAAVARFARLPPFARRRAAFSAPAGGGAWGLFAEQRLTGQFHPVLVVDGDDLDLEDVAHLAHALHLVHVLVVQLADVAQPVTARQNLDERPEILDRGDTALVHLADLHLLGQRLHL